MNETQQALDERVIWQSFLDELGKTNHASDTLVGTVLSVIFVASVIGNALTTTVICSDRSMRTVTNYYIFNLAVSDLIVTFSILVELYYRYYEWNVYNTATSLMCKVQYFAVGLFWNNSTLTVTALAVERYLAIWYPLLVSSKPAWKRVLKIIVLLWIIATFEILLEMPTADLIVTTNASTPVS
ncbi:Pyrokinin-1 receptor [Eumeta japonica]|uniref:Pyrokinin-1 receptor n=1 Tax=Eumeta variegata TaxID=151549 RepID=A0A4C1YKU7_EUMVA|nr:Pyrokinin-1 receptor [Eumeta japonica]